MSYVDHRWVVNKLARIACIPMGSRLNSINHSVYQNKPDPLIMDAPVKEEAKADPTKSTDDQAVGVGSRWSLTYNFGNLR